MSDYMSDFVDERDLELFEAFIAGFDFACEGFNGEYIGERYRATVATMHPITGGSRAFYERMLTEYRDWRNR